MLMTGSRQSKELQVMALSAGVSAVEMKIR